MSYFDLTPEEEKELERQANQAYSNFQAAKTQSSPALAQNISNFQNRFPWMNPDILVPTVQAFTDGKMSEQAAIQFINDLTTRNMAREAQLANQKNKNKKKSWWERNVASKVRRASRYTFAALQFFPDTVTNAFALTQRAVLEGTSDIMGSQAANRPNTRLSAANTTRALSTEGFVVSTQLGTLLQNEKVAGDGYFLGGQASQLQAERARDFRGTINGSAVTPGRFVANLFVQPGSKEYNILSGLVDAALAIGVPSVPGGSAVTGTLKYGAAIGAGKVGLTSLAGLRNWESSLIIPEKVHDFLNSRAGRKVINKMVNVKSLDEAVEMFPTADIKWLTNVVDKTDEVSMRQFLNDSMSIGDSSLGVAPRSVEDWNISNWDIIKLNNLKQRESMVARYMAAMPGKHVIISGGSDREKLQSLKNVKNYLRLLKIDEATRVNLVEDFGRALVDETGDMETVAESLKNIIKTSLTSSGADSKLAESLVYHLDDTKEVVGSSLLGAIDGAGDSANHGGLFDVMVNGVMRRGYQPLNTAGAQTEMSRHILMLPDARLTRRIMSNVGWVTGKAGIKDPMNLGKQRLPVTMVEGIANYIWKPLTLLTGGYVLRNMADSILRMSADPKTKMGLTHPFEWILVASHRRASGDILGAEFKGDPRSWLEGRQLELGEAASGTVREFYDPVLREMRQRKTGVWDIVRRSAGKKRYAEGVAAEIGLLASDRAFAMAASGMTTDEIVDALMAEDGQKYIRGLQTMWSNKPIVLDSGERVVGTVDFIDELGNVNRENLVEYVNKYVHPRIDAVTGGSTSLRNVIATRKVFNADGNEQDAFVLDSVGRVAGYNEEPFFKTIYDAIDDPNVALKETYKKQTVINKFQVEESNPLYPLLKSWNKATDYFFAELYPKREAWLNRSPVFRQYYYYSIGKLVDSMAADEVGKVVDSIVKAAASEGKVFADERTARIWVGKYVNDSKLADKMYDIKNGVRKTSGNLTKEQIDAYAKGYALDETKRLFYNAAEKSNFADIFRIITPFASAWAEVTTKWAKLLSQDPENLKRIGVTVQGLRNADPDNDGKGFFYKDPKTGQYVFNYPFSDQMAPFMGALAGTVFGGIGFGVPGMIVGGVGGAGAGALVQNKIEGVDSYLQAPLRSLSMGFSLFPGLSPYAQIAASWVLKDKPQLSWIEEKLLPYGTPEAKFIIWPSWAQKIKEAITANPETDRIYGDLKIETMRALSSTGKYDLSSEQGILDLEKDAADKARWMLLLQGIGQVTGPARPTPEYIAMTSQGNIPAAELSKAWFDIREKYPDKAVEVFLETFGDDAFLYAQPKTKTAAGGLQPSKETEIWIANNRDIMAKYPEIAGYFAPSGNETDWRSYVRMIERGDKQPITSGREFVHLAQEMVAKYLYRSLSRSVGPRPTEDQSAVLRDYKNKLIARYPGYEKAAMDNNAMKTKISSLYEAAFDPQLKNNPATEPLRTYFSYRDQALKAAQAMGLVDFSGKKASEIRALLRQIGEELAVSSTAFERIWNYILFNEVDAVL